MGNPQPDDVVLEVRQYLETRCADEANPKTPNLEDLRYVDVECDRWRFHGLVVGRERDGMHAQAIARRLSVVGFVTSHGYSQIALIAQ